METASAILQGVAALAWPIIVIIIFFSFRRNFKEMLESAKWRKFTLKGLAGAFAQKLGANKQKALKFHRLYKPPQMWGTRTN